MPQLYSVVFIALQDTLFSSSGDGGKTLFAKVAQAPGVTRGDSLFTCWTRRASDISGCSLGALGLVRYRTIHTLKMWPLSTK